MKIDLKFFSIIREIVGSKEMPMEISPGMTVEGLLEELLNRYPGLEPYERSLMVAVNRDFADVSTILKEGDEVALMPPIGGG